MTKRAKNLICSFFMYRTKQFGQKSKQVKIMKYVGIILFLIVGGGILLFLTPTQNSNNDYLRIHIRANSNSVVDQSIKYEIKREVVEFLTPYLAQILSKEEAVRVIGDLESEIKNVCDQTLNNNGFDYSSEVIVRNEFFPSRNYEDLTLADGYYDALIINLGSGTGDNWWCVVYPPLCFVGSQGTQNIYYRSILYDIIKKFFD